MSRVRMWVLGLVVLMALATGSAASAQTADTTPPLITITTPAEGAVYHQFESATSNFTCVDEPGGSGVDIAAGGCVGPGDGGLFPISNSGGQINTRTPGDHAFTVQGRDRAGNATTETHNYNVIADVTPPTVTFTGPADGQVINQGDVVNLDFSCADDEPFASGLATFGGNIFDPYPGCSATVDTPFVIGPMLSGFPLNTANLGSFTATVNSTDRAGNLTSVVHHFTIVQGPPKITIVSPADGDRFAQNQVVNALYGCSDGPFAQSPTCAGTVANGTAIDTSTVGVHAFTVNAIGSTMLASSKTVHYTVTTSTPDTTNPTATLTTPAEGASYTQNQVVNASYSCADNAGGSGVIACVGTVANGAPISTSALGPHTFTVNVTDVAGNTASVTHNYSVVAPPPIATTLTAANTSDPTYVLKATLKAAGSPLAGKTITFKAGNTSLCTATTNAQGVATCSLGEGKGAVGAINNNHGYTATFAAGGGYLGSTASGSLSGGK